MTDAPHDWTQRLSQKARDAAERDMQSLRERAALSWPTEAVPAPVPFYWGDYDRLTGVAEPGAYWDLNAEIIHIRRKKTTAIRRGRTGYLAAMKRAGLLWFGEGRSTVAAVMR